MIRPIARAAAASKVAHWNHQFRHRNVGILAQASRSFSFSSVVQSSSSSSNSSNSSKSDARSSTNKSLSEDELMRQPFPSTLEQIKMFPDGVKRLWNDVLTYRHIQDAAATKSNSWTSGKPPRRQAAFQRKLIKELQNVAVPVVGYVVVPIAGNIFVVLAIAFPKVFLSWHFLSPSQQRSFASDEHWFRIHYHREVAECFWDTLSTSRADVNRLSMKRSFSTSPHDAAGPVFGDIGSLLALFDSNGHATRTTGLSNFLSLPDQHIMALVRSSDLLRPPFALSSFLLNFVPSSLMQKHLNRIARNIHKDDELLLEEGHHEDGCASLTAEEVVDACLLRGLPAQMSLHIDEMRQCLTNHLHMVAQIPPTTDAAQTYSFLMHLPAIRESMKK